MSQLLHPNSLAIKVRTYIVNAEQYLDDGINLTLLKVKRAGIDIENPNTKSVLDEKNGQVIFTMYYTDLPEDHERYFNYFEEFLNKYYV